VKVEVSHSRPLALAANPACVSCVAKASATSGVICAAIETSPGPWPSTAEKSVTTTDLTKRPAPPTCGT
jgi:hypothetical protein